MARTYTASDGRRVLTLKERKNGGFVVRCPLDPELRTTAETLQQAFDRARETRRALRTSRRAKWKQWTQVLRASLRRPPR